MDHSGVCSHLGGAESQQTLFHGTPCRALVCTTPGPGQHAAAGRQGGKTGAGEENGHKQMLGQAAAVLVSFPARLAAELDPVRLAAFLERLAVARPAHAALLGRLPVGRVVEVVDGAALQVQLPRQGQKLVGGQARGRRGQAADEQRRARHAGLGHGVPTGPGDGHGGDGVGRALLHGGGHGGHSGGAGGARHALAAGDAVGGIEGAREHRVRVVAGMGLSGRDDAGGGGGRGNGGPVGQRSRCLLHFLERDGGISTAGVDGSSVHRTAGSK